MKSDYQPNVFTERFAELKAEKGETNKDLQEAFGLSLSAIINYQTGKRTPDIAFLYELAKHYDVTTDYLLGLSGCKSTDNEDMQTACKITGLLEKTILELTNDEMVRDVVNMLVNFKIHNKYGEAPILRLIYCYLHSAPISETEITEFAKNLKEISPALDFEKEIKPVARKLIERQYNTVCFSEIETALEKIRNEIQDLP